MPTVRLMLTYPKTSRKWETYTFTHLVPTFKMATLQKQKPLLAHAKLPPSAVQRHGVVGPTGSRFCRRIAWAKGDLTHVEAQTAAARQDHTKH